jgi:hypothetical protein
MHTKIVAGVLGALLLPSVGLADFAYTGVEVSYVDLDFSNGPGSLNGDGIRVTGTYEINNDFFAKGEFEDQNYDAGVDGSAYELGVGYRYPFSSSLDFVGTGSYVKQKVKVAGFGVDDDALAIGGGIRAQIMDALQVEAGLQYVNWDQGSSDTGVELRGRYYFKNNMAFSLEVDRTDSIDTLSLGFRAEF